MDCCHLLKRLSSSFLDAPFAVSLTLSFITPHGGSGKDVYNLSCIAITPQGLAFYKEFVWDLTSEKKAPINITYSNSETSNQYGSISTSVYTSSFISVASVVASCTVKLYYGVDTTNEAKETTFTLYLPGVYQW